MKIGNMVIITSCTVLVLVISCTILLLGNKNKVSAMGDAKSVVDENTFARQRKRMVEEQIAYRDIKDKRVLEAMEFVPRHLFIPEEVRFSSYYDQPVPIGFGQTISR